MKRPAAKLSHAGSAEPLASMALNVSASPSTSANAAAGKLKSIAVSSGEAMSASGWTSTGASLTGVTVSTNPSLTLILPSLAVTSSAIAPL